MQRPLRIGRLFGIPIYLHWTFFLVPLLVIYLNMDAPDEMLALGLASVPLVFGCVMLHELGHALAARFFGIGTRDITLYPIGGVASLDRMSEKPWEEFWITVAGPAVNVVIAAVLFVVLGGVFVAGPDLLDTFPGQLASWVFGANVFMVLFNLIPAFPMDGGRILRALLAMAFGYLPATRIAVNVGRVVALGMAALSLAGMIGLFGIPAMPMLLFIAMLVFMVGSRELQMLEARERANTEEPMMVIPVYRPAPQNAAAAAAPDLLLKPNIQVSTWDAQQGAWIVHGPSLRPHP